jgi:hypothetical protein
MRTRERKRSRRRGPENKTRSRTWLLVAALVFLIPSWGWAQYAPYQGGPPLGPGSLAPQQQPMPTSAVPGNFTYGPPQGYVGEHPAYGQTGVAGGSSACAVGRNDSTRLYDQGGAAVPYPAGQAGHY